jgi:hypothetical protein
MSQMPRELGSSPQTVIIARPDGEVSGVVEAAAQIERGQTLLTVRLESGELAYVAVAGMMARGGRKQPMRVREVGTDLVED